MTVKTILVSLTNTATAAQLLDAAALLARRDNAHVIGLFVTESLVIYPNLAMHIPEATYENFIDSQRAHAEEVKAIFEAKTNPEYFSAEWRQVSSDSGYLADTVISCARSADLVILPQEDEDDRPQIDNLQEQVIKRSGRPVLVIPRDYSATTLGENIVLGWSETREATRAAHDLLAVAIPDANLRLLRIGKMPNNTLMDAAANDLAAAIARHGPKVEIIHREKDGHEVADLLGQEAFEMGADMLATGAFGHSRTYDFVIGAATRLLLASAKLPVLYAK